MSALLVGSAFAAALAFVGNDGADNGSAMTEQKDDERERPRIFDMRGAADELRRLAKRGDERFPLGYSLDEKCGMIGPGELGLLWARSGSGKSTLVLNMIARTGTVPTVVFCMEMAEARLAEWLTAIAFPLNTHARDIEEVLRWGPDDPRYEEVDEALGKLPRHFPYLHFFRPELPSVDDLVSMCDAIWDDTGVRPRRVFIDHLSLMRGARDYEGVSKTTAALHSWAMTDRIAVIAIQQTTRGGGDLGRNDGHIPVTLSSGVYAGEADADWIYGVYRPERDPKFRRNGFDEVPPDLKGVTRLQVIKNRPFGELREVGIELQYDAKSRRLFEKGGKWRAAEPVTD